MTHVSRPSTLARCLTIATTLLGSCVLGGKCSALDIDLQFASSFFASNATARATINQAAADISAAITTQLAPIDQSTWERTIDPNGTPTSGEYSWRFQYTAPGQGTVQFAPSLPANTVRLFVRGQDIGGNTLGTGGSAGIGFEASYSAFPTDSNLQNEFADLVDQQSAVAQNEFSRGGGPTISSLAGTANLDFDPDTPGVDASWNYSVSYGPAYGTLALDTSPPDGKTLEEFWHLDYNTPVASGKNDLYSVALHEILHALGIGSSDTWDSWIQGTTWTGPEAVAENGGSGATLIQVGGSHIFEGVMSRSIVDGEMQEAAMDPTITVGNRKYLTTLDLAFLRDINYDTITPNFDELAGDYDDNGIVDIRDYTLWRDNVGAAAGTLPNDTAGGTIGSAQYLAWKNNFAGTLSGSLSGSNLVPEPATECALLIMLLCLTLVHRAQRGFVR